jgi:hypothetical protein
LRSQTSVVSRWLVMPMAAMPAASPAAMAVRQVATVEDQMSAGSCSTQPEAGKRCGNSCWPVVCARIAASNRIAREEVVPWSIAKMLN